MWMVMFLNLTEERQRRRRALTKTKRMLLSARFSSGGSVSGYTAKIVLNNKVWQPQLTNG